MDPATIDESDPRQAALDRSRKCSPSHTGFFHSKFFCLALRSPQIISFPLLISLFIKYLNIISPRVAGEEYTPGACTTPSRDIDVDLVPLLLTPSCFLCRSNFRQDGIQ